MYLITFNIQSKQARYKQKVNKEMYLITFNIQSKQARYEQRVNKEMYLVTFYYNTTAKFLGSLGIAQSKITSSPRQNIQIVVENPKIDSPQTQMYGLWRDWCLDENFAPRYI